MADLKFDSDAVVLGSSTGEQGINTAWVGGSFPTEAYPCLELMQLSDKASAKCPFSGIFLQNKRK